MEKLSGEWFVLKDDKIIEHSKDIKNILELSKNYNDKEITISKIPSAYYCIYWFFHEKTIK